MNLRRKWNIAALLILSIAAILTGGFYYITNVQHSLWLKSVTDILEVTAQGRHALDTYIEKDLELLHWLAVDLSQADPGDPDALQNRLLRSGGTQAASQCVDLSSGLLYSNHAEAPLKLEADELEAFAAMQNTGVLEPFLDIHTGVRMIGYYERITWPDGTNGVATRTQPLSEVAERFSLSFYNNTGFSYVVNREGDILIRSQHRNSNRTFHNLYDIIDLQGNPEDEVRTFREALEDGKRGVARFHYQKEDYVFCYVPLENAPSWYVVSIVPNRVIMEQADDIVQNSQVFFVLILACLVVLAVFFIMYRNYTTRILKAKEEARKAAESANLAKSRFLSNMSHDIRTPMNAVVGMARLATDHAEEPDKVREYLKNIGLSGQLLVGLINDILDMSKIESGKMTLNSEPTSLAILMDNLVKIIQPTISKKSQTFDIRLHGIEHEMLSLDSLRLNQVMINLLSNAMKFTPQGGSICMDVTESPSMRRDMVHFTFRVEDTGIGMRAEFLEHIFDSFTREQDSRVNKTEGSGLGMAITKMIVDIMGGSIHVESTPGVGSVFTVELDFQPVCEEPPLEEPLPEVRLLFADDDPDTCRCAGDFLRELGIAAEIAQDGWTAAEMAVAAHRRGNDYDMVLLDWKMPGLSGMETALKIRGQTGFDLPIIIVSAYDWSSIEQEAKAAGVNGFIQKPLFKSTLRRCVTDILLHAEHLSEPPSTTVDLTGKRILLAEDNELNQVIAKELLESLGALVETVDNGLACTERFAASEPWDYDLILMDIQMPLMNGYDAAKKIRAMDRPDAQRIPIFAMTADAFAEDIEAAKAAGMNYHLAKPLDIPAMMRELKKHLNL